MKNEKKPNSWSSEAAPRSKLHQRQQIKRQIIRTKLKKTVPLADVVITNSEHHSVAIWYQKDESDAPIVLIKGANDLALAIQQIAKNYNISIVENAVLAHSLYTQINEKQKIHADFYEAVAEILAKVYHVRRSK